MNRWLITWVVTDRHGRHSYLMEVHEGTFWEEAVAKTLRNHNEDSTYPNWCVVNVQPLSCQGHQAADELVEMLKH